MAETHAEAHQRFVAPARVNLLGEHTDYTGGLVLPMAIPFSTVATIQRNESSQYRFNSKLFGKEYVLKQGSPLHRQGNWSDYPVGVLHEMLEAGIGIPPFELSITGDVPFGAGLSSSASVEMASCLAMLSLSSTHMDVRAAALLCQRAENRFVESPCGIMDQFVIAAAKAGHALLLNTRDLTYDLISMQTGSLSETCIVIVNSTVKHSIAEGGYGLRRQQVEAGQTKLREAFPAVIDLGSATLDQLEQCRSSLSREAYLRCRHIISENGRVRLAKGFMLAGDAVRFGELMLQAHASQRDDFECSCAEIDFLVETATELDGCFGARMTGGGFGGCTVNLVSRVAAEPFVDSLKKSYLERYGLQADTYVCEAVDGAFRQNGLSMEGNGE